MEVTVDFGAFEKSPLLCLVWYFWFEFSLGILEMKDELWSGVLSGVLVGVFSGVLVVA